MVINENIRIILSKVELNKVNTKIFQEDKYKYHQLINQMPSAYALHEVILDKLGNPVDFRFIEVNKLFERKLGFKAESVIGHTLKEIMSNTMEILIEKFSEVVLTQKPIYFEFLRPELNEYFEVTVFLTAENQLSAIFTDITKRIQAKKELQESEARFRAIFENSVDAIVAWKNGINIFVNPAYIKLFGFSNSSELIGRPVVDFIAPEHREKFQNNIINRHISKSCPIFCETRGLRKDYTQFDMEVRASTYKSDNGTVFVSILRDITERKKSEELISSSEIKFRTTFQASPDAVSISRLKDGLYTDINQGFTKLTGYTKKDVIGKTSKKIKIWVDSSDREKLVRGVKENGYYNNLEAKFRRKDGTVTTALLSARIIELDGIEHLISVTRDISEHMRNKLALATEKERLAVTLRSIADGVITADTHGNITMLNKASERLTGWNTNDASKRNLSEVFNIIDESTRQKYKNPVDVVLTSMHFEEFSNNAILITKDKREVLISYSSSPIHDDESIIVGVVIVFRDMTEKKELHDSLQRAQRLESIGLLAGGIAHDFNNLLSGIFGCIELALEQSSMKNVEKHLTKSLNNIDRARALTQQLLTFAKGGNPIKEVGALFPFVKKAVEFTLSGSNISCKFNIQDNLWACDFDKNQIGQVVDNLIINAMQAMPNGGKIEVSAINYKDSLNNHKPTANNHYVKLTIKDQGIGIQKEFLSKIFDPYYTTKAKGHGFGLATSFSIINKHGGYIEVESESGKGSSFHVYLPATTEEVPPVSEEFETMHSGSGVFLVLDDEEIIRDILKMTLESFGYSVVLKDNGTEAVSFFSQEKNANRKIAGMIFDLTIPGGMGGIEAIKEIRKICSDTPAFVSSGYSTDPVMANPEKYGFTASISKPFMINELSAILEKYIKK